MEPIILETERLLLRRWRRTDAEDMFAYAADPDVGPSAGWKPHESVEESREIIEHWIKNWDDDIQLEFALELKESGKVIGAAGIGPDGMRAKLPFAMSIGYVLGKAYWGRGLMTEAVGALTDFTFRELNAKLLSVTHYPGNERSRRVIEKCGFTYEGRLRKVSERYDGSLMDHCVYSMTAAEYWLLRARESGYSLKPSEGAPADELKAVIREFEADNEGGVTQGTLMGIMSNTPLILEMSRFEEGCVQRVNHFLKVFSFAKAIGEGEGFPAELQEITETAALVHDIGIKPSLEKYGSSAGAYQEKEGPGLAEAMLSRLGYPRAVTDRVCFLVGHHHTYTGIDGLDYQALVEADFLVNIYEGGMERPEIEKVKENIFRTKTGTELLDTLFLR